jgi:uncharacterized protein (TIGR03083 family)
VKITQRGVAAVTEWDATSYDGKETILRVVRNEAERLFELAERPGAWEAPTACENWKVKDIIGHLIDTTEGYFTAFETARSSADTPAAFGLPGMHDRAGEMGISLGVLPQQEAMSRIRGDLDKMMGILEPLTPEEWTGFMVPHFYMGPLPAFFYAAGQLMDYGVHSWDIRQGAGQAHGMSGDAADLLVPFMFVLWQSTIKPDADLSPFTIGIRVTGRNGGEYQVSISDSGMQYEPGSVDDLPAVIDFDAASLVLTTFGRSNSGTVRGDLDLADRFLNLFYPI